MAKRLKNDLTTLKRTAENFIACKKFIPSHRGFFGFFAFPVSSNLIHLAGAIIGIVLAMKSVDQWLTFTFLLDHATMISFSRLRQSRATDNMDTLKDLSLPGTFVIFQFYEKIIIFIVFICMLYKRLINKAV